ncbi:MAG: class I SAM-dependent methyltransferase [Bacteroidota bacterium]
MNQDFWNQRYQQPIYAYGEAPNVFFAAEIDQLAPGKILLPAEGEGRNAVFAARKGWEVEAFDISREGQQKAQQLAGKYEVNISYQCYGFANLAFPASSFDCIALIFAHQPAAVRAAYFSALVPLLKPGGTLILEGFSTDQLGKSSGGPKRIDMLFSEEQLNSDFAALSQRKIFQIEVELDEGPYHQGVASVIRMVGIK